MAKVRCEQGHMYDDNRFYTCPHCSVDVDIEKITKQSYNNLVDRAGEYNPKVGSALENYVSNPTVAKTPKEAIEPIPEEFNQSTIGAYIFGKQEPVVAWVICMNNDMRGQDFRLVEGRNIFSNQTEAQIYLPDMKDGSGGMAITYASLDDSFHIESGDSEVSINGEIISNHSVLEGQCVIDIDGYNLVFIPFCEYGRNWNE